MDHSSPLAAIQPPAVLFRHGFRSDVPTSFSTFRAVGGVRPNNFNFKDLSVAKSPSDYFNVKSIHGSSPAGSLAADLSQNFHIGQSPQLVTPRRSLFSSKLFGAEHKHEEIMTTPPLPSSSPANMEIMDMSPLPHKIPFALTTQIGLLSPTPESPLADVSMSVAASPLQESPVEDHKPTILQEKKRPIFLRPSLVRAKAHLAYSCIPDASPESRSPPFKFGNGTDTPMSLEDMFEESPQQDRVKNNNMSKDFVGPRLKPPFGSVPGNGRGSGSPTTGAIRKNSSPFMRRKQCRRSLSMFEHPDDIVCSKDPGLSPDAPSEVVIDVEPAYILQLPHFIPEDQPDTLPRIDKDILVDLLDGKYDDRFENIMIIDCRFEYEFEGGHINAAVNHNDKEFLATQLFSDPKDCTVLIFHCEYSAHRAPIMASFIRHQDRAFNIDQYPKLTYPEMYILDGGYSAFFAEHRSRCNPQNYVEMASKEHEHACERGLGKVKQRSKFGRAKTFAFGQQSPRMEDSPSERCQNNYNRGLESPFEEISKSARLSGRRMLSY